MPEYTAAERFRADQPITIGMKTKNILKNRYPAYPPYDNTRVILATSTEGKYAKDGTINDYINASYVNMKTGPDQFRKWICTQAPLESTISDFWNMVIQSKSELIVMVTHLGVKQAVKYWPEPACTMRVNQQLSVNTVSETAISNGMIDRVFSIQTRDTSQTVRHIQFVDWPDLGVPGNSINFTLFLSVMRKYQSDMSDVIPTIIHCSAGVGRTGTAIGVATGLELMDNHLPVDPINILLELRKQRGGFIQDRVEKVPSVGK